MRRLRLLLSLFVLFMLYLGLMFLNQRAMPDVRLDLTENKLFTLSHGSISILKNIDYPVQLDLYYSEKEARPYPQFRQYAERVIEKIEEYAAQSNGKIRLTRIDPEPYSSSEDQAIANGIAAVPLEDGSGPLYFGITARTKNKVQSIGFIKPESEQNLEYELSKLIQTVQTNKKPKVALLSDLPVSGRMASEFEQASPAWVVYRQLSERYELIQLSSQNAAIPSDLDVLWVMHPRAWPASTVEQLRRYVENGGHTVIMLDPYAESVPVLVGLASESKSAYKASDMAALFSKWGIGYDPSMVVLDSKYAWLMQLNENQFPKRNPALISLPSEAMNQHDVVTANLDRIVFSSAGALSILENSPLSIEPLLQSSDSSKLITVDQLQQASEDPEQLLNKFISSQEPFVLAARFTGKLTENSDAKKLANFIVIADTDMLNDRLWVLENSLFGQSVFSAQASNGDLFFNVIDQLSGTDDLISIRSRGMVSRPFTKVDQIRRTSEQAYRDSQTQVLASLQDVQNQLNKLQTTQKNTPNLIQSPEYKTAIAKKVKLRQQLRSIQSELNNDVDRLGQIVKSVNIFSVPIILLLIAWAVYLRRRMQTNYARMGNGSL
jgi:ABC-type uncharacterized transport system involved in gliding motility auxiliary subunit